MLTGEPNGMLKIYGWEGDNIIFETPWSIPEPVIEKISRDFPNEEFKIEFADEDIGGDNKGFLIFKDGEIVEQKEMSMEYASKEIWGWELDEMEEEYEME